jgi:polysaccharide export outer membrane protein
MNRSIIKALGLLIILVFTSCASHKGANFVDLTTKETPSEVVSPKEKINIEVPVQVKNESLSTKLGYLIGPEDVLGIEVWNHPDITRDVIVNHEGKIRLPPAKENMSVMGLNATQLEEKLAETLSKFLIEPVVFVTIKEYNSQRVIALGETAKGMYTLKRPTTLVEFLGQIGGPTENADTSRIRLIKKDGTIFTYNINDLINISQKRDPVFVSGGDTVYVPPIVMNKIYILGEVNSPKVLEFKEKLTLIEAITGAGGYTVNAVTKSIIVIRGELGSHKGIRLNLNRILKKGDIAQNIELKPGDIVYVPRTFIGNVERFLRLLGAPITWYFWFLR